MIRHIFLGLFAALWLATTLPGVSDPPEPPVRLERKPRPEEPTAPEKIPTLPKEIRESDPETERTSKSLEETLQRITRNLEKTDERLAKKDVGEGTSQIQTEVVRDFDALLEQMRQQQQQQQQQNSERSRKSAQKKPRPEQGDPKQSQTANKGKPKPQPGDNGANQQMSKGQGGGGRSPEETRKLTDLYKDVWGHLPETLRQQMDAYGREQFMPKYNELLKQYYSTLSEKGRRKGD